MPPQELALYSAESNAAHMHEGNNQTAHLADFSGFKGRDDHAVPAPDEVIIPCYIIIATRPCTISLSALSCWHQWGVSSTAESLFAIIHTVLVLVNG
jgi:hypothetical protein